MDDNFEITPKNLKEYRKQLKNPRYIKVGENWVDLHEIPMKKRTIKEEANNLYVINNVETNEYDEDVLNLYQNYNYENKINIMNKYPEDPIFEEMKESLNQEDLDLLRKIKNVKNILEKIKSEYDIKELDEVLEKNDLPRTRFINIINNFNDFIERKRTNELEI